MGQVWDNTDRRLASYVAAGEIWIPGRAVAWARGHPADAGGFRRRRLLRWTVHPLAGLGARVSFPPPTQWLPFWAPPHFLLSTHSPFPSH
eukprot:612675-Pleurochrysis_carterae.AAC.1